MIPSLVDSLSSVHLLQISPSSPVGEHAQLESTLKNLLEMLDRVLAYAQEAAAGKPADAALGRYLMGTLGGTAEELGKGGFTSSLQVRSVISRSGMKQLSQRRRSEQDTLMMSYLANLVRAQAEVSARLALVTAL